MTEHEKSRKHYEQSGTYDPNMEHFEKCEVNSGAWVLITRQIPVDERCKPLCMAWGNADDFKEVIKQLDLCEDSILDVYEEHLKEGVTRDKIKSFMAKEKWFSGAELAEYFDVLIDEKAAVAACASDYFEKYNHVPESIKGTATKDIVDAVLAELENRNNAAAEAEKQRIEAEKQDILADLDMYGI